MPIGKVTLLQWLRDDYNEIFGSAQAEEIVKCKKRDNLIPETFLPLQESGRGRETTGSFSMRAVEQSFLHSSSFPPHSGGRGRRPSVFCLGRRGQSIFHVNCLTSTKGTMEQPPMEGRARTDGERRGEGLAIVLSD